MAPEMLQRRGDNRSDIYSLGIILFECLTGEVPFKGDSEWEVLRKHETEDPTFPEHVGSGERAVILRCLAKDPASRYETVAELLHDLQAPAALGESMVIPPRREAAPRAPHPEPAVSPSPTPAAAATEATRTPFVTPAPRRLGPIGALVHLIFRTFEFGIFLALIPVRAVAMVLGRAIVLLVRLPFRLVGAAARAMGLLLVFGAVVMLVVSALALLGGSPTGW